MRNKPNRNREMEQLFTHAEPWENWESQLVFGSIAIAVIGLIVLAVLINIFIL